MKHNLTLWLCLPVLAGLLMAGCIKVDKDYDFSKLDDDNRGVGNVFTAPLGKITMTLDDIFAPSIADYIGSIGKNPELIGVAELPLKFNNTLGFGIDGLGLTLEMIDMLTSGGKLTIKVSGTNSIPAGFSLQLDFINAWSNGDDDNEELLYSVTAFDVPAASASGVGAGYSNDIEFDSEKLENISRSNFIRIQMLSDVQSCIFNSDDALVVVLKVEKTGGIELF